MTVRQRWSMGLFLVALVASLASAAGQEQRLYSGAETGVDGLLPPAEGSLPRTPWGAPDLRGVWNNSTDTPVERLTEAEKERGALAQQAVIAATQGTGAAWIRTVRDDDPGVARGRPAGRADSRAAAGGAATADRPRECPRGTRRGRLLARPQQLGSAASRAPCRWP